MCVGLRLLTHSSHAVAARAVRHCETVGAHTQPATHSGARGTLLLPLGQHLARGSGQGLGTLHGQHSPLSTHLSLSQQGCWLQSSRHGVGVGASRSHKNQRGRPKPHPLLMKVQQEGNRIAATWTKLGPSSRTVCPMGVGPGLNLALIVEQANGDVPRGLSQSNCRKSR